MLFACAACKAGYSCSLKKAFWIKKCKILKDARLYFGYLLKIHDYVIYQQNMAKAKMGIVLLPKR
jgi:hypothetical protein